ncbi:hypothetical protein BDV40DRAFT_278736 [Aspergillus tamarii]|uniref:Uncharacterized protein n=1 Tax=Aspergillus tamarii TaxID=41984 RepID=A0A5N6UFD6_ASPTM|nr:hypothetical protein BDV40DRAFT_278736 [Aspergillus tamarii]
MNLEVRREDNIDFLLLVLFGGLYHGTLLYLSVLTEIIYYPLAKHLGTIPLGFLFYVLIFNLITSTQVTEEATCIPWH